MARPSLHPGAAASIGGGSYAPSSQLFSSLASCVASVELTASTLEASNDSLSQSTGDFARFARVLASKRHFDLVAEGEIRAARDHLSAEIAPQLKELILRAEEALQKDEREAKLLKSKVSQQTARLEQLAKAHNLPPHLVKPRSADQPEHQTKTGAEGRRQGLPSSQTREEGASLKRNLGELQRRKDGLQREIAEMEAHAERA
ncbi:hypothetical protein FA10DRAFT_266956 [Acaromyces ingoldii]|uniref:DASH complex subunit SPC19 n=1 Tax=Acaromyces ingoldii TaxID=215250 RepID=A0A316YRT6_9BASI|nr:hypothetical protein FA10DRAFT_266956 [Acaromyces ingoldii]PWN90485.1 hypothetical protein FA10DRAFT_266956 [Acaromyces ingoldii]